MQTSQYLYHCTQKLKNDGATTLYDIESYVTKSVKKFNNFHEN